MVRDVMHTNPEEKPEEFKALRAAYEEALRSADQEDSAPVRDESPVGLWMEQVLTRQDRTEIEQARKQLMRLLDEIEFNTWKTSSSLAGMLFVRGSIPR